MEYELYLYHHGVKGMKWGVRRYQRKDGSLTPAGRKRYSDDPGLRAQRSELDSAKAARKASMKAYSRADTMYRNVPTPDNLSALKKARSRFEAHDAEYRKTKLKYDTNKEVARIKDDGIEIHNKSKHRLRLEEQYRQIGMDEFQAQAAANNRIRTEKILAATAALTITACAAYVANKKLRGRIDTIVKAGESLQRIEGLDTNGKLHGVFYASSGKHDAKRYSGMLAATRQKQTGHAYLMKLQAASDIKVASRDNAAKAFGELYKNDPTFRTSVQSHVSKHFAGINKVTNVSDVSDKNIKKMYDNFNSNLGRIRNGGSGADTAFFNKLKSAGYGAVQDINDMKYSGFNARKPQISI